MNKITVEKVELLEVLRTNRATHRAKFDKAQEVYRERVIRELETSLRRARAGDRVEHYIRLPIPEDHTDDYNRVVEMLEMHKYDSVELTQSEFQCYVQDEWGWLKTFAANTTSYLAD
ncbi:hypothetical protein LCGC14_2093750 [marine sediment metagenome]|uniref:Uncharacterized protein n=1 Tax=marine sediment metagenome TaxID=412755 RepID=A0A0F9H8T0_9ZZZZ